MRALVVAIMLLGCSAAPVACDLGRVTSCPCPGGAQGAQECGPGAVWGACVCPTTDPTPDASDRPQEASTPDAADVTTERPDASTAETGIEVRDASVSDAETDRGVPPVDVGRCGGSCVAGAHVVAVECIGGGLCVVRACERGFADCNSTASDGCEADTMTDRLNCGACRAACPGRSWCGGGRCI